jgi:hypothetical protein
MRPKPGTPHSDGALELGVLGAVLSGQLTDGAEV